jgi:tetrahydromethanopterin S-methyltransferase subunit B
MATTDPELKAMQKEIDNLKAKQDLQRQIDALKAQAPTAMPASDPMKKLFSYLLPVGVILLALGLLFLLVFGNFLMGMTFAALAACVLGVWDVYVFHPKKATQPVTSPAPAPNKVS